MPFSMWKFQLCSYWIVVSLHLAAAQTVSLSSLVPQVDQPNYKLTPDGQQYTLYLELPDGGTRTETVKFEIVPESESIQALQLNGQSTLIFKDTNGRAYLTYTAGTNGYHIKYTYSTGAAPTAYASVAFLKSATG